MDGGEHDFRSSGNWVRTLHTGVWQVYRVLDAISWNPATGAEESRRSVFCKRFVNDAWKRSFSAAAYAASLVFPLDGEDQATLQSLRSDNPKLAAQFDCWLPPPIDCLTGLRIDVPADLTTEQLAERIPPHGPLRHSEIERLVHEQLGLPRSRTSGWTLMFRSRDHEVVDGHLVFRFSHVHPF
jgi:hypothetical protein